MKRIIVLLLALCLVTSVAASDFLSVSLLNQDPDPALAGNIVELRIGVTNEGSVQTSDMVVEFEEEYPFFMVPGDSAVKEVGFLDAYGTSDNQKTLKYRIKVDNSAPAGSYTLSFLQYKKGAKELGAVQTEIDVDLKSKEGVEVIYIDKTTLVPGQLTDLKFVVNNVGSAPLRDLSFAWDNDENVILPVGSDNTKYIKFIEIGDSAELDYQVIADSNADPGLYKLNLNLYYDDPVSGSAQSIETIAGIYVGGGTDFDVAFSESSSGEMSFTVANIGSNPANSVSVSIPNQQGWRVTGSKASIIGNLNKGDYTVASFALSKGGMNGAMPGQDKPDANEQARMGSNYVSVQIDYTNTMGQRISVNKQVEVNANGARGASMDDAPAGMRGMNGRAPAKTNSFWSIIKWPFFVLLVVVAYFGYRRYKRKGKKR
jgi:hypothetical protein